MQVVTVYPPTHPIRAKIQLVASKAKAIALLLIINALTHFQGQLDNISAARDSQTMRRLLQSEEPVADVL
ncbi:MAG: hypothetical protein R2822_04465 [Spirosomataceae bacterium]